jgi:NNP family nitrate/nitrite transporter-like MFS transporter
MVSRSQQSQSGLVMSTVAVTICFAVWVMFVVIGIPLKAAPGLNETESSPLVQ